MLRCRNESSQNLNHTSPKNADESPKIFHTWGQCVGGYKPVLCGWRGQCPSGRVANTLILAMCRDSHGSHAAVLCQPAAGTASLQPVPRSIPGGGRGWWLVAALQWLGNLGFWSTAKPRRVLSVSTPCPVPPPRPCTCDLPAHPQLRVVVIALTKFILVLLKLELLLPKNRHCENLKQ